MDLHIRLLRIASSGIPSENVELREHLLIELELFEEECAVERVGDGVEEELEAVEDLDGASPLDADNATEDARGRWAAAVVGGKGRGGGVGLGFDAGVVVGDVDDDEWVELEGQAAAAAAAAA